MRWTKSFGKIAEKWKLIFELSQSGERQLLPPEDVNEATKVETRQKFETFFAANSLARRNNTYLFIGYFVNISNVI